MRCTQHRLRGCRTCSSTPVRTPKTKAERTTHLPQVGTAKPLCGGKGAPQRLHWSLDPSCRRCQKVLG